MSDKEQLLELIEVIEEQQEVIALMMTELPPNPLKNEIKKTVRRIKTKTKNVKSYIKFMARSEAIQDELHTGAN